jgi:hypothetical protein
VLLSVGPVHYYNSVALGLPRAIIFESYGCRMPPSFCVPVLPYSLGLGTWIYEIDPFPTYIATFPLAEQPKLS